jgi:hypothetical protein
MNKLKIKIGLHEFEGEGSEDYLSKKFAEFKELVEKTTVSTPAKADPRSHVLPALGKSSEASPMGGELKDLFAIDMENQRLTLRVHVDDSDGKVQQVGDVMLMLLYGYKMTFQIEEVGAVATGKAIKNACGQNARVDHGTLPLVANGFITRHGSGRSTTYGLTPKGVMRAEALIRDAIAKIHG